MKEWIFDLQIVLYARILYFYCPVKSLSFLKSTTQIKCENINIIIIILTIATLSWVTKASLHSLQDEKWKRLTLTKTLFVPPPVQLHARVLRASLLWAQVEEAGEEPLPSSPYSGKPRDSLAKLQRCLRWSFLQEHNSTIAQCNLGEKFYF